ncbi:hypothetical protein NC653_029438 [Populus alba x Populus x berolinensis]|uniref:Uncharacterized protein n=1 Tax=Populus alba x Populus x berolinensis TaxID=444605 RepID=A0AAD6M2B8_9ROSI|nr:hypothetical protein NC653_029438 [Populus alba x Populus x berolinensis]
MFPLLCLRIYAPDPFHSQVRSEFRSSFGPLVIDVGREYFGVQKLQGVFTYDGNAVTANVNGRFSGILVGFPNLGEITEEFKERGVCQGEYRGSCVEAEDRRTDGLQRQGAGFLVIGFPH